MKKLLCIILLLLCLTANVSHSQSFKMFGQLLNPHWSSDGLVFYWRGIEAVEAVDESLHGNHGTITGATWVGDGLDFSAQGHIIDFTNNLLHIDAGSDFTFIVHVDIDSYGGGNAGFWRDGVTSEGGTFVAHQGANDHVWVRSDGIDILKPTTGTTQPVGLHHHAWVLKSSFWIGWYLDGKLAQQNNHARATVAFDIYRFGYQNSVAERVDGRWFSASLYNRALSASEIAELYLNPNLPMQQTPIWLLQPSVVPSGIIPIIQAHARRRRAG